MLTSSAPVLLVRDVVAAAEYYRDKLGFSYERFWGDPPTFVILNRDNCSVMLRQVEHSFHIIPNWKVVRNLWDIYFWVDDVEKLYIELQERGATIDYTLCTQPYGCREFGVQDLDGHDIAFGQVIAEQLATSEIAL